MQRYVISAQRSGLNWTRFCVEHFYGLRTPGKTVLIDRASQPEVVFQRSHDALYSTGDRGVFLRIDPGATAFWA